MTKCELCRQDDHFQNVRCHKCREYFHFHKSQYGFIQEGWIIIGDCPSCGYANYFQKRNGRLVYQAGVVWDGQPVIDLGEGRR